MQIKKGIVDVLHVVKKHIGLKYKLVILYQENIIQLDGMNEMYMLNA
jgi:hypothetical protein